MGWRYNCILRCFFRPKEEWRLVLSLVIGSTWALYKSWFLMIWIACFSATIFSQAMILAIRWATAHRAHHTLAWMQQLEYSCTYIFLAQWATVRIVIIENELPASPMFWANSLARVYATCQICQHDGVFQLAATIRMNALLKLNRACSRHSWAQICIELVSGCRGIS